MTDHSSHSVHAADAAGPGSAPVAPYVRREPTAEEFSAMHRSPEFRDLRKTYRQFTFPMSVAFFIWYVLYVLVATYASEWMATPMWGMNIGIWFGLAQFLTTFLITALYVVYANRNIGPKAAAIREAMED